MKKSGNTYDDGFNDGAKCAWEEHTELINKLLEDVVNYGLGINPNIEESLSTFKFDIDNIKKRLES